MKTDEETRHGTVPIPFTRDRLRIGVYICHCGTNIAGMVDVDVVARYAAQLDSVTVARHYAYMCSEPGQALIKEDIRDEGLNRVVVASCSPLMHEVTFRRACAEANLNPFLFQMTNIREHCSWVSEDPVKATQKAMALVAAAVRRVSLHEPLEMRQVGVKQSALVVGEVSPVSRLPYAWLMPGNMCTWSNDSPASVGTWPSFTRPSQPSTVLLEFSPPKWCPWDAMKISPC